MNTEKKYTAFIFARGGSKGVLDKNIRAVAGKPLIAHSIETALSSSYIKRVVVSTDSRKIADISKQCEAEVLMRPAELAEDATPELLAWKHALSVTPSLEGLFISLPATSPLRQLEDIDSAIESFLKNKNDIIFGITPSHRNPYLNMVKIKNDNTIELVNPGVEAVRRQDVPSVFDVTTCIYVAKTEYIKNCSTLMQGKVGYTIIPPERSLDIDTEYDLYLADLLLTHPFSVEKFK